MQNNVKQAEPHVFSSPHLENIGKNQLYLEEIKNLILNKSRSDVWKLKQQPNFNTQPYAEWRRGDACCSIM